MNILTAEQTALIEAIQQVDENAVKALLDAGLDPNFIDPDLGPVISIFCDELYQWWEDIQDAYLFSEPFSEQKKQQNLQPYIHILQLLIDANINLHLWDSTEIYGPLWDAASAGCAPVVEILLQHNVDPNLLDDEGETILSSISRLWLEADYDEIALTRLFAEQQTTLALLRKHGAKMTKEL